MSDCKRAEANHVLNNLVGQPLRYGIKSPDMDLYDLGFGDDVKYVCWDGEPNEACTYAIHLTSEIHVDWKNGNVVEYCYDTPCEEFDADIRQMIDLRVRRVALSDKNDLWLDLGRCYMIIVTHENGEESWRFFLPGSGELHLVASDLWLRME